MINNQNITDYKRKFEKIYRNLSERLDVSEWKSVVGSARKEDRSSAVAAVVEFLYQHRNLPSAVVRTILRESDIRNCPSEAAGIFGTGVLQKIHKDSLRVDLINQNELPAAITDRLIEETIKHAEAAQNYLDKGQMYMAGKEIAALNRLCPGNQGLRKLSVAHSRLRVTAGIPPEVYGLTKEKKKKRFDKRKGLQLESEGSLKEAAAFFEKAISDNYENYEAYSRLGRIYLKTGQISQADYIADLLIEKGILEGEARVLKGWILEGAGQKEDALYYYHTAFLYDRSSAEALQEMKRMLAELDQKENGLFIDDELVGQCIQSQPEPEYYDLSELSLNDQVSETLKESDNLIGKGRLSEAYYELSRTSEKYPDTTILIFKKAFVLYLMKRGTEARKLLKSISKENLLFRKAQDLMEDIDCDLRDHNNFSDASDQVQAEILFGAGKYSAALSRMKWISAADMDAAAWAFRGQCEIENGHLKQAMEAFSNAIEKDPQMEHVHEIMAMVCYVQGQYEKAEAFYDTAIRLSSKPRTICEDKARMLYELGAAEKLIEFRKTAFEIIGHASDVDGYAGLMMLDEDPENREAAGCIEAALIAGSTNTLFYKAAYKLFMTENLYYRTLVCMNTGIAEADHPEQLMFFKACALFNLKKMDAAEIVAARCLTGEKKDSRVMFLMGQIQEAHGNLSGALKWILDASVNDPENHDYAFEIAEMYFNRGEYAKAQVYYSKALVLDNEDSVSFKRRAYIYEKQNNDRKALGDINCALLLDPSDPSLYILIGNIVANYEVIDGQVVRKEAAVPQLVPEAEEPMEEVRDERSLRRNDLGKEFLSEVQKGADYFYTKAIEAAPDQLDGYLHRAESYASQNRPEEAEADLDQALTIKPDSPKLHMMKGIILLLQEKVEEASREFDEVIRLDVGGPIGYSYAARCSLLMGDNEMAVVKAKKGLNADNNYVDLYLLRGIALFNEEQYEEAAADLTIAIMRRNEISPSAVETAYRYRGIAYECMGMIPEAINNYDLFIRLNPEADDIEERMSSLQRSMEEPKQKSGISSLFKRIRKENTEE